MSNWKNTIGVDFGTANSHFAERNQAKVSKITWEEENPVLETAICYKKDGTTQSIGQTAAEDYGAAKDDVGLTIKYWFKPEIVEDDQARKATIDFIKAAIAIHEGESPGLFPSGVQIVVGAPANCSAEYKRTLRQCFDAAGLKNHPIEIIHEPVGALIALLQQEKIDLRLASKKVLVVDKGAGTCDFTLIGESGELVSWGDSCLGGRIFDDLFYQLILKFHPDADRIKDLADKDRFDLHYVICRGEKEQFSNHMNRLLAKGVSAKEAKYTFRPRKIGTHGLKSTLEISYQQFLDAARNYKPTGMMFTLFSEDSEFYKTLKDMQTDGRDLLEWFRTLLKKDGHYRNVEHVIFAGGSSKLPFVKEIVEEECGTSVSTFFPREPYRLISEGLSQLPRYRHQLDELSEFLKSSKDTFIKDAANQIFEDCQEWTCEAIDKMVTLTTEGIFNPVLRDAHANGIDSQEKLEEALENAYENRDEQHREDEKYYCEEYVCEKLQAALIDCRTKWLKEHAEGLDLISIEAQQIAYSIDLPAPLSKGDVTGLVLGGTVLGGVGVVQALSAIGWTFIDPAMSWVVAVPVSAALAFGSKLPYFTRKKFKQFTREMEDGDIRADYLREYAEQSAAKAKDQFFKSLPKGQTRSEKSGYGLTAIKKVLSEHVADAKAQVFKRLSKQPIESDKSGYDLTAIKKVLLEHVADTTIAQVEKLIYNFSPENLK